MEALIKSAREILVASQYPVVLTGAGISAESGIPTFRGADGLWNNYRAEELATNAAFRKNPRLVWEWYNWRRSIILSKSPNAGHEALATLQKIKHAMPIITQNVDGLHTASGANNIIEMHGNIFKARCLECNAVIDHTTTGDNDPICPSCGGKLRPHIVWFGEMLDPSVLSLIDHHLNLADLILVVGTSGNVYPAASFGEFVYNRGGKVIEINPEPVLQFALQLNGKAGEILPLII